jgi:hypothetical protein
MHGRTVYSRTIDTPHRLARVLSTVLRGDEPVPYNSE